MTDKPLSNGATLFWGFMGGLAFMLGFVGMVIAALIISILINGFCTVWLWHWYIVPFGIFPELNYISAAGLWLIVNYMTAHNNLYTFHPNYREVNWAGFTYVPIVFTIGWALSFYR